MRLNIVTSSESRILARYIAGPIGAKKAEPWPTLPGFVSKRCGWLTLPKPPPASQSQEAGAEEPDGGREGDRARNTITIDDLHGRLNKYAASREYCDQQRHIAIEDLSPFVLL